MKRVVALQNNHSWFFFLFSLLYRACCQVTQRNTGRTPVTGHSSQQNTTRHATTIPNWNSEINMTFNSVTLARTI